MRYGEALVGELRLLDAFGLASEIPEAMRWRPASPSCLMWTAPMLSRALHAGRAFNLGHAWRRIMAAWDGVLMEEYSWFDETAGFVE